MRLKPITAICVLLLLIALISTAGCTSNSSTPTVKATATATPTATTTATVKATPTVTASPSTSSLSASEFNTRYAKMTNYTIATPFTKTTNARGHVVYSGMVKFPYSSQSDKVSVELCTSQSDARQTFQKIIASAEQQGYTANPSSNSTLWLGTKPIPNTSEEVYTFITGINNPNDPTARFSAEMGIGYSVETIEGTAPP